MQGVFTDNTNNMGSEKETNVVIIRYGGELALKSPGVRNWYEKILMKNIAAMLDSKNIPYSLMRREWGGRIFIETTDPRAAGAAADVFGGVVSTSSALITKPELDSAAETCAFLGKKSSRKGGNLLQSGPEEVEIIHSHQQI